MSKTRICGKRCHLAKHDKCRCWCGGTFHGENGIIARGAFKEAMGIDTLPTTERQFRELTQPDLFDDNRAAWRDRVAAAQRGAAGQ